MDSAAGELSARLLPLAAGRGYHLLLSELGTVRDGPRHLSDPAVRGLAPRLRRVLDQLLTGKSEKEIAAALELSKHTVHEYIKMLYREIGVNSRAELLARWM
jgi:DNA-binding CsgD family transcriptional regulator